MAMWVYRRVTQSEFFLGGFHLHFLVLNKPEARRSFPNRPSPKTCWMGGATKDVKLKGFKDVAEDREF